MTKIVTTTINHVNGNEKRIVSLLLLSLVLLVGVYGFCVHAAVSNIVAREASIKAGDKIASSISTLEVAYANERNSINLESAYASGFKDATNPHYIHRGSLGRALSTISMQ